MRVLVVVNDPPYGTERSYNGLRLTNALAKRDEAEVRVFLMGDAVACAVGGQQTPNGYYKVGRPLRDGAPSLPSRRPVGPAIPYGYWQ